MRKRTDRLLGAALNISGGCNLRCRACSLDRWYEKKGPMPFESIRRLESALPRLRFLDLSANCEPLLNQEIVKFLDFIRNKNENLFITINTNGMLLDKKMSLRLLQGGIDRICVSVDSARKENFERTRKRSCFETVISNIKDLSRQRRRGKNRLRELGIITVASKDNIRELEDILDLIKDLEADTWIINGLLPHSRQMAGKILYGRNGNPQVQDKFFKLRTTARSYGIEIHLPFLKMYKYDKCILRYVIIDADGEVSPCSCASYKREYYYLRKRLILPKISFGNINNTDLFKIWDSADYKKFRKDVSTGIFPEFCRYCLFNSRTTCPIGV